ncbi:MAG: hypothetical protein IJO01_03845 [Oscillospiraceae bacterium]|nr:hypothetical protein [Oscillospiraceae bacterium]
MIADLFIKILNLSIGAVPIMAALLVLRLLFKKAVPRKVFYIAWALVFLRLMVPFSLESNFSFFNFMPRAEVVEENIGTSVIFIENSGTKVDFPVLNHPSADNPNTDAPALTKPNTEPEKPSAPVVSVAKIDKNHIYGTVWIFGTAGLLLFGIIGYFAVLKKTKFESVPYTENIRLSDFFKTPIVCGLIRPKIILPMNFDLDDDAKVKSVIAHECTHIRRGDNFWRLLASFTLYVHWFNPLVWICYDAFIRDMEVSCDEEVLGKSESDIRGEYAESLVSLSGSGTNPLYGGVLSFGESAIKERVKCIMNFKRATLFIVIICVAVAVALGVIFLTNPSAPGAPEIYQAEFQVYTTDIGYATYYESGDIETSATLKNEGSEKIWLSSDLWLEYFDGEEYVKVNADITNAGTVTVKPGEVVNFCSGVPAEGIHEKIKPGDYRIIREVFVDEELTKSAGFAEHIFSIEDKLSGDRVWMEGPFSGKVVSGNIAEDFIPSANFPEEEVLAASNKAEHYSNWIYNICSGLSGTNVNGITLVFQPNDKNYVVDFGEYDARRLMGLIGKIEIKSTTKNVNPNTGGMIEIYIETESDIMKIRYDGRLVIAANGYENASIFDGEVCKDIFFEIQNFAEEKLSGAKEVYVDDGEANPQIGVPTVPTEKEPETGENSIFTTYDLSVTFFNNTDKIAVPYKDVLTVAKLCESLYEIKSSELGNVSEITDAVEIVRNTDGKKYHINLYEHGFTLSGSAVPEEYLGKAFSLPADEWNELCEIVKEVNLSRYAIPYWIGLIHEKNVKSVYVESSLGGGTEIYPTDDCFALLIDRLMNFVVPGDIHRIEGNYLNAPNEDYVSMVITFNNGTVYNMIFTRAFLSMVSNDTNYGLKYLTEADGYDAFLDFAEGGPANPMTGKPVIYLYPEKETLVSVNLDFDGKLTYTYPAINNGWRVLAKPDGTLTNLADGSTHYYLFWEGTARPKWTYEKGFVVKGSETEKFLRENLAKMGLTPREYNDFITYWVPKMQENKYNLISFSGAEYSEIAKLTVDPKPDSVIRIHMMWKAHDEPIEIEPQVLPTYERKGFTLVEWGGTELY